MDAAFWRKDIRLAPRPRFVALMLPGALLLAATVSSTEPPGQRLNPVAAICALLFSLLAYGLLWLGVSDPAPALALRWRQKAPGWLRQPVLRAALVTPLILWGVVALAGSLGYYFAPVTYKNDAVAYLHRDAELVLQGKNPYTNNDTVWYAARRWSATLGTPLVRGQFAGCDVCYPSAQHIKAVIQDEAWNPADRGPEFDPATGHNYPAGSIWLVLPLVWAGAPFVMWLNCVATLAMAGLVLLRAPAAARWGIGAVLLCQTIAFSTNFDAICIVFVLAAWHWRDRSRISPLLLGWACAVKQLAWFFVPFYFVEMARRYGWRAALQRTGWLGLAFVAPNMPFIAANPGAWLHSQIVPMSDPMFPAGMGVIAPALSGLWPLWPPLVYSLLEGAAWAALLAYQARRKAITSDGLFLALLPLFFARRDLINYAALLPVLALWLVADLLRRREVASRQQGAVSSLVPETTAIASSA